MGSKPGVEFPIDRFPIEQLQTYCMSRQHLEVSSKTSDLLKVVDDLCGLHATSTLTPYLSLFSRMKKFDPKMLDFELGENGRLVRIRGVRGTLFVLPRSKRSISSKCFGKTERAKPKVVFSA